MVAVSLRLALIGIVCLLFLVALAVGAGWLIVVYFANRRRDKRPPEDR
jgi:hypothetical protein